MTDTIIAGLMSAGAALLGGVIGGSFAVWSAHKVVKWTSDGLEAEEIRRQKVICITAIAGLRWTISPGQATPEWKAKFISELNKVSALWSDDSEVLRNIRDLLNQRSDDRLVLLIRNMSKSTSLPIHNLGDADLLRVFL
jgi:hypothetical protein